MLGRRRLALGLAAAGALSALLVLICACGGPDQGRRATPTPMVDVTEDAAQRCDAKIGALMGQEFNVEFTDQEVTSYVALRLARAVPLTSPQIRFLPEGILFAGDLTNPIHAHVALAGTVRAVDGRLAIDFQRASLGGLTVPRFLLSSLSDSISEMLSEDQGQAEIQRVELTPGRLIVAGRARQP